MGWVCCWFSSLLQWFISWSFEFPPFTKINIPNSNSTWKQWTRRVPLLLFISHYTLLTYLQTCRNYFFKDYIINFHIERSPCFKQSVAKVPNVFPLHHCNFHLYWVVTSILQLQSPVTKSQRPVCIVFHLYWTATYNTPNLWNLSWAVNPY